MNHEGDPAGTTHAQARETDEFRGIHMLNIHAFAPLGENDSAWMALRTAAKQLFIHTTGENDEYRRDEQRPH